MAYLIVNEDGDRQVVISERMKDEIGFQNFIHEKAYSVTDNCSCITKNYDRFNNQTVYRNGVRIY